MEFLPMGYQISLQDDEREAVLAALEKVIEDKYQWLADWGETEDYERILTSDSEHTQAVKREIKALENVQHRLKVTCYRL